MQNFLKENWFRVAIIAVVLLVGWALLGDRASETEGKWQAIYYPDGCLACEDDYIFSPFFDSVNGCINWIHAKAGTRSNNSDAAECAFSCKKDYDLGGLVCKETVDVLGKTSL